MALAGKPLDQVNEDDLRELISVREPEGRAIDYKVALPGTSDGDKREFLFDLTSFANAIGGHIVFGIAEESGLPIDLAGLPGINPDREILRLDGMHQTGVSPRLQGVAFREVPLSNGSVAIVVRIPRSLLAPHMVTAQGAMRFYSRNSRGKFQMDVTDLRVAFTGAEQLTDRLRNFRIERVASIAADDAPVPMSDLPKVVLHIVPFTAFDVAAQLDAGALGRGRYLPHIRDSGGDSRYNFDGFITYMDTSPETGSISARSYLQLFRGGSIESATASLTSSGASGRVIGITALERDVMQVIPDCLGYLQREGVDPPLFVMLSLTNVRGSTIPPGLSDFLVDRQLAPIDRDVLLLPETLIDRFDMDVAAMMRPAFDALWNAGGYPGSRNYDEAGRWAPRS